MEGQRRLGAAVLAIGLLVTGVGLIGALTSSGSPAPGVASTPTPAATILANASPSASLPASPVAPSQVSTTTSPTAPPTEPPTPPPTAPPPTPSPTPAPSPTPTDEQRIAAFLADFVPAVGTGDADLLVPLLHPAVIERYGEPACRERIGQFSDATFNVVVRSIGPRAPWDYITDGLTTTIPDAWTIPADATSNGETTTRDLHLAPIEDEVRWFTDCGTPIGASPSP